MSGPASLPPDVEGRYLQTELARLRLLLRRRILWVQARAERALQPPASGGGAGPADAASGEGVGPAGAAPGEGVGLAAAAAGEGGGPAAAAAGEGRGAAAAPPALLSEGPGSEEARFYQNTPELIALHHALAEVHERLLWQLQAMEGAGRRPALATLVRLFGLSPFACDVVLLCLAPELDPELLPLYARAQGDASRAYPTPHLALALFGGPDEAGLANREELMAHAPLRRYRLLSLDLERAGPGPIGGAPMRLSERAIDYLLGVNRVDERLEGWLQAAAPGPLTDEEQRRVARLAELLGRSGGEREWPLINVVGPTASGRRTLAEAACSALSIRLYELDPAWLLSRGEARDDLARQLEREALLLQCALYVDRAADDVDEAAQKAIDGLASRPGLVLFIGSREQVRSGRDAVSLFASAYDAPARLAAWRRALEGVEHEVSAGVEALVEQFDFDPAGVERAVRAAEARARVRRAGEARVTFDDLWGACRDVEGPREGELARRVVPSHGWDDIVLPDDVASALREIAAQVENRHAVYEGWGFGEKLGRGRGISVLFAGPSGTGKTMAAEILANHLRLYLYRIDLSGVVSKYIGETEKNLRKVFDSAERGGAILFFDEADALFGKRSEVKDSHDRYANIEVNYLLQRMEDYGGLAILATNMKSALDDAFLRRLRFVVDFPFPEAADRGRIWRKAFPERALGEPLDVEALSRLEVAGGNIKNIALNAAFLAAQEKTQVRNEHVFRAARREYEKLERVVVGAEFEGLGRPRT